MFTFSIVFPKRTVSYWKLCAVIFHTSVTGSYNAEPPHWNQWPARVDPNDRLLNESADKIPHSPMSPNINSVLWPLFEYEISPPYTHIRTCTHVHTHICIHVYARTHARTRTPVFKHLVTALPVLYSTAAELQLCDNIHQSPSFSPQYWLEVAIIALICIIPWHCSTSCVLWAFCKMTDPNLCPLSYRVIWLLCHSPCVIGVNPLLDTSYCANSLP